MGRKDRGTIAFYGGVEPKPKTYAGPEIGLRIYL